MPDKPPVINRDRNPSAKSIGVLNRIWERHRVASQLKVFIADGTAMIAVITMKNEPRPGCMPLINMWWPQTTKLKPPIAMIEAIIIL